VIRTDSEYRQTLKRLEEQRAFAAAQEAAFEAAGLTPSEVETAMEPLRAFQAQLAEEIDWYERVRRREIPAVRDLAQIGQLLIALRVASGLSQRELAERLGVSEPAVSRDERNEYHGITAKRAQRILDAVRASVTVTVEPAVAR
jgi:DNA-directed RNA polymerase specialized sigma subunit